MAKENKQNNKDLEPQAPGTSGIEDLDAAGK